MSQAIINFIATAKERVTQAWNTITTDHASIHEGKLFYAYSKSSILAAGTLKFTFTTPAASTGKYVHFRPSIISTSGDKVTMTMTEIPTAVSGGTTLASYNRNRISTVTPESVLKTGVTLTESATVVDIAYIGGGTGVGGTQSGAGTTEADEIVLKQETVYSITLLNESASANTVFMKIKWYEQSAA